MYQPAHFREDRIEVQHDLIRAHPLGLLITAGARGLMASHLPFLIDSDASLKGTLRAHLSRANEQSVEIDEERECLVVFQGPQGYISPSWYATKSQTGKVVPTWDYATVHAWGTPRIESDPAWIRSQIHELTASQESNRTEPWAVGDAPPEFLDAQIKGILGIVIEISRIKGKWKVSQNSSAGDRRGVIAGLRAEGAAGEALADLVAERGRGEPEPD